MIKRMNSFTDRFPRILNKATVLASVFLISIATGHANAWQDSEPSDDSSAEQIAAVLSQQADHWNKKDIEGFMATYWKSDELTFSGGGKTIRGWQATLDRYREKYPPEKMGSLSFDKLEVTMLGPSFALVLGQWHLKNGLVSSDGNFSLVLRKIDGHWKIIHDHSSTLPKE